MTSTEILLITVNLLIVIGVAYVFLQGGPKADRLNNPDHLLSRNS